MTSNLNVAIHDALSEHKKFPLRSESIDQHRFSYLGLSADGANLERLENSDWQVIYGRRGTGKTHLLRSFEELKKENGRRNEGISDCCLYFSAQDFLVSNAEINDSRKAAYAYYQIFLEQFTDSILRFVDNLTESDSFVERIFVKSAINRREVDGLALEICENARFGSTIVFPEDYDIEEKETDYKKSGSRKSADLSLGLDSASYLSFKTGIGLGGTQEKTASENKTVSARPLATVRFDTIRSLLLKLLDNLHLQKIFILIDEWPTLDPSGMRNIQPIFANLLKRTFMGTGRISIKIATNRFQTQFSSRDERDVVTGLEIDADIFEAVNLDHALLGEPDLKNFYSTMLFKRLCYVSAPFRNIMLNTDARDIDEVLKEIHEAPESFVEMIFKNAPSFAEMIRGCEGIPREFLELFNRASSRRIVTSLNDRWNIGFVREIISESHAASVRSDLEYNSPSYRLLNITIKKLVVESRRREFIINIDDTSSFSSIIDILLEKRIIHEFPSEKAADDLRNFKIYLTDYGYCLDWLRSYQQHHGVSADEDQMLLTGRMCLDDMRHVWLKSEYLEEDLIITHRVRCSNEECRRYFSPEVASYVRKSLCPYCFEPQGEKP